jgi:hypothetical protein
MIIQGTTSRPTILKNSNKKYVIIGSIDHGMEIPKDSMLELIASLENVRSLMMETPEEFHKHMHPMSTEILVKASVGRASVSYLSGNRANEDIGKQLLKYSPQQIAEVFVPAIYIRNSIQLGQEPTFDSMVAFTSAYRGRFGFLDAEESIKKYMRVLEYWGKHQLDPKDLDHFSYDFEKFVGDVREFELWQPELKEFRTQHKKGKIAVCVGDYHVPFVQSVFEGNNIQPPNWKNHFDTRREDRLTPQRTEYLKGIYKNILEALE